MSDILSKVERDFVISYLQEKQPDLILRPLEINSNVTNKISPILTPLKITKTDYKLVDKGIIFIPFSTIKRTFADKTTLSIFFYYQGRGLFFETQFRHVKQGYALIVPSCIIKQVSDDNGILQNTKVKLILSSTKTTLQCLINKNHKIINSESNSLLANNFFDDEELLNETPSFMGRILPFFLLKINGEEIVLGSLLDQMDLSINDNIEVEIEIPTLFIFRKIKILTQISNFISDDKDSARKCIILSYIQIQEEDKRFLTEYLK